jgi:hypothetical protein
MGFVSHFVDDLRRRGNVLRGSMVLELDAATIVSSGNATTRAVLEQKQVAEAVEGRLRGPQPSFYVVVSTDGGTGHLQDVLWT